ncbi:MAG: phosphoribosylglycinamide formyltransferase [Pseudomonadota bacterium]
MTGNTPAVSAVILISGGGTNLQAFIDSVANRTLDLDIRAVIANRPGAYGLERASAAGIPARCVDHTDYADRDAFDAALAATIADYAPTLIILAGFMRILTARFVDRFEGRILNIHPSLLPRYPGLNTHQRALDAGDEWHGVTVHFVTSELDGGPPILQGRIRVRDNDDAESLAARVLEIEHRIYPEAVRLLQSGRLVWREHAAWLDGQRLEAPQPFS